MCIIVEVLVVPWSMSRYFSGSLPHLGLAALLAVLRGRLSGLISCRCQIRDFTPGLHETHGHCKMLPASGGRRQGKGLVTSLVRMQCLECVATCVPYLLKWPSSRPPRWPCSCHA